MGQLVLDRPILLTTARHAFTSFRADLRSGTLHTAFDVHVAHPVYWPYGVSSYLFVANWKKKKKTSASIPFLDFPILFFFSPLFWGGKIWRFEKNLHTKILRDCSRNRDLTVDRLNGLLILVLKHITSLSRREVVELFPFFFACSLGCSSLRFLFYLNIFSKIKRYAGNDWKSK